MEESEREGTPTGWGKDPRGQGADAGGRIREWKDLSGKNQPGGRIQVGRVPESGRIGERKYLRGKVLKGEDSEGERCESGRL